ncbi:MAG: thioredoxin family protein [Patescibacteria group bacterium]
MNSTKSILIVVIVLAVVGIGSYSWLTPDTATEDSAMMEKTDSNVMEKEGDVMMENKDTEVMDKGDVMMAKKGSYEAYSPEKLALADKGKVVLFFRASWCPTCRTLDADIKSNLNAIPEGVTILDVNYDNSTALKQKYGVTYQHTLVQVDSLGNQITKWTGSPTLAALISNIK